MAKKVSLALHWLGDLHLLVFCVVADCVKVLDDLQHGRIFLFTRVRPWAIANRGTLDSDFLRTLHCLRQDVRR